MSLRINTLSAAVALTVLVGAVSLPAAAQAPTATKKPGGSAEQIPSDDPNSPVQQVRRERYIDEAFKRVDTNKDGVIEPAEFQVYLTHYLTRQREVFDEDFAAADKNKDGKISRAEAKASNYDVYVHFSEIDTNGDGYLSKEELIDFIRERNRRMLLNE